MSAARSVFQIHERVARGDEADLAFHLVCLELDGLQIETIAHRRAHILDRRAERPRVG